VDRHVHRAALGDRNGGGAGLMDELLVFGRTEYAEPLIARATAAPGDDVLAANPAEWVELVSFPLSAVQWIIRDGEDAVNETAVRAGR
jgi:hypothetical protein